MYIPERSDSCGIGIGNYPASSVSCLTEAIPGASSEPGLLAEPDPGLTKTNQSLALADPKAPALITPANPDPAPTGTKPATQNQNPQGIAGRTALPPSPPPPLEYTRTAAAANREPKKSYRHS